MREIVRLFLASDPDQIVRAKNMDARNKEFDELSPGPAQFRVKIRRATAADIIHIYPPEYAGNAARLADRSTCEAIRQVNRDNIWTIIGRNHGPILGFYAMVMLSEEGLAALLEGRFAAHDPDRRHVVATGESPAAIYKWGVHAPASAATGIALVAEMLQAPLYRHADLYGTGTTDAGRRIMRVLGFKERTDLRVPHVYQYTRLANRAAKRRDAQQSATPPQTRQGGTTHA